MTGINGDYYLDVDIGDVYKKSTGTWSLVGNIKGPAGSTGDISLSKRAPAGDVTIPAGYSAVVAGDFDIALGHFLEIESDGIFEIL